LIDVLLLTPSQAGIAEQLLDGLASEFPELSIAHARNAVEAAGRIESAEILFTFGAYLSDELLQRAGRLRWIQALGSGMDGIVELPSLRPEVLLTNARGATAHPVSETALALMFALSRDLPQLLRNQRDRVWKRWAPALLRGKCVVIVGLGAIAEALAVKCQALGMRTIGVSRRSAAPGFERILPRSELHTAAALADFLVLLTPYDESTHHLIDATVLSAMRPEAYLVNVARGGVVDEAALIACLQRGAIAGAALDVFAREPLPEDSPLWSLPNVIVSPHMAGLNQSYAADLLPILRHNVRAFLNGDIAAMLNVVHRRTLS
jgi:D-2-hydroxyacid dehydrogenase (NADP+)